MTIDEIYRLVQTFANKEQRGFITPKDFNLLAKQAQLELYNKRLSIVIEKSQPKKSAGFYAESLTPDLAEQDISTFLTENKFNAYNATNSWEGASFTITNADYIVSIFIMPSEELGITTNIPVDIVSPKDVNQILRSSLVKPSIEYPIALLTQSGTSSRVHLFPESINQSNVNVVMWYYDCNKDDAPLWDYVTIAGKPVYNSATSRQPVISKRVHGELVVKILEYLGVTIREADLVQYAQANEVKADS